MFSVFRSDLHVCMLKNWVVQTEFVLGEGECDKHPLQCGLQRPCWFTGILSQWDSTDGVGSHLCWSSHRTSSSIALTTISSLVHAHSTVNCNQSFWQITNYPVECEARKLQSMSHSLPLPCKQDPLPCKQDTASNLFGCMVLFCCFVCHW